MIVQPAPRISTTSDLIWKQIRLNSEVPRSLSLASVTWVSFVVKDTKPYFFHCAVNMVNNSVVSCNF